MRNTIPSEPSPDVIEQAIGILMQQKITPKSPGALTEDGQVTFCAAAALAVAGLQLEGKPDRLNEFCNEIATSESVDSVRNIFVEQGWSVDLCNRVLMLNDKSDPYERTRRVIRCLREI